MADNDQSEPFDKEKEIRDDLKSVDRSERTSEEANPDEQGDQSGNKRRVIFEDLHSEEHQSHGAHGPTTSTTPDN